MKKRILPAIIFTLIYVPVLNGQCWEVVYQSSNSNLLLLDVFFINDTLGWVGGSQTLLKTTNGGEDWQSIIVNNFSLFSPSCLYFLDDQHGWVASNGTKLFYTQDGGNSWENLYIPDNTSHHTVRDMVFMNQGKGWAVLENGNIYHTNNGGEDWVLQFESESAYFFKKLMFVDENKGWACGQKRFGDSNAVIFYTENGGQTWLQQYEGTDPLWLFHDIYFQNENLGWVTGTFGRIYKTENGGATWIPIFNFPGNISFESRAIYFVNTTLGWAGFGSMTDTTLNVSTNSGIFWHQYLTDTIGIITEIQMLNTDYGWAVTSDGKILRYQGGPAACGSALLWPPDGAGGIPLQPTLSWSRSPGCVDGYRLRIGTAPGLEDLLPAVDVGYDTVYTLPAALPAATQAYVSIQPYNHVYGAGETCQSYSFTTAVCPVPMQVDTFFCSGTPLVWADTTWEIPGDYELVYALPNGCDSIIQLHLEEEPTYFTEVDTTLAAGAVYEGVPHYADTSFVLLYSAANGCDSLVKVQIRVVVGQREPANATHAIKIYPNPVQSDELIVEVSSPAIQTGTAQLYSAQGVSVRRWAYSAVAGRFTLDVSGLPPGVYGLEIHPGLPVVRVVIVR